jgi:hypothetical protein
MQLQSVQGAARSNVLLLVVHASMVPIHNGTWRCVCNVTNVITVRNGICDTALGYSSSHVACLV